MSGQDFQFDFDAWSELAKRDPQAYFRQRERVITEFIASHPGNQESLLALQARIDGMRAMAGSPQQAVRQIGIAMADHLEALGGHLQMLREETEKLNVLYQSAAGSSGR